MASLLSTWSQGSLFALSALLLAGCRDAPGRVVGLLYLPEGAIPAAQQSRIEQGVRVLAESKFQGTPDTVDATVYAIPTTPASGDASRYLVVLPFGDREVSRYNDTATAYVLTVAGRDATTSEKVAIGLGDGAELYVLPVQRDPSNADPEVVMCVLKNDVAPSQIVFTVAEHGLVRSEAPSQVPRECPRGGAL